MEKNNLIAWLKVILLMVLIIGVGLVAINQAFAWYYKAQFLAGPCKLCVDENPNWKMCYESFSKPVPVQKTENMPTYNLNFLDPNKK